MNKKLMTLTTALTLGMALTSFAQTPGATLSKTNSQAGAYIGAGLGSGGPTTNYSDDIEYTIIDAFENMINGRIYGGYLWQTDNTLYGVEAGYYGTNSDTENTSASSFGPASTWKYSSSTADLLGVIKYQFNSRFNIFGKAGVAYLTNTTKKNGTQTDNFKSYVPELSIGAGYNFTKHFSTNIAYTEIFSQQTRRLSDGGEFQMSNASIVLLNLEYPFG